MGQLNNNPIIDAGVEISASFNVPSDAIVGILFNSMRQKNQNVGLQKLPVSNIPDEIRRMDPNLKDKPTHQLSCSNGFVQIGENVLSIGVIMPYVSWGIFMDFIKGIFKLLSDNSLIKEVSLAKLRYLNFFKQNVFNSINLSVTMDGVDDLCSGSTAFRTEIPCGMNVMGVLQITNGVHVKNESMGLDDDGSLIDIQTISKNVSKDNLFNVVDNLHEHAEILFIKLTKKN